MQDILAHPQWTPAIDSAYARWFQSHAVDPARLYRDSRVAFALSVGLLVPADAAAYLALPAEYWRADGAPALTLV